MLHIRTLMVFAISMIFFLPHSFAFSWQEDITNSVTTGNTIYGVYNGMPFDDFKATWADVPGWKLVGWEFDNTADDAQGTKIAKFEKVGLTSDDVKETFSVLYYRDTVYNSAIDFYTPDKKTAIRIYNYAKTRFFIMAKKKGNEYSCTYKENGFPVQHLATSWYYPNPNGDLERILLSMDYRQEDSMYFISISRM